MSCGASACPAGLPARRCRGASTIAGWRLAIAWGVVLLGALPARAHRPNESTAVLRWEHGRLEGTVTLPLALATRLLDDPAVPALRAENFPAARARLTEQLLAGLSFSIAGRAIRPVETAVEFTAEGEVQATLLFSAMESSALEVRATFLSRLPPDSFCLVRVWDGADRVLASRLLVRSELLAAIEAPPAKTLSVPAPSRSP